MLSKCQLGLFNHFMYNLFIAKVISNPYILVVVVAVLQISFVRIYFICIINVYYLNDIFCEGKTAKELPILHLKKICNLKKLNKVPESRISLQLLFFKVMKVYLLHLKLAFR